MHDIKIRFQILRPTFSNLLIDNLLTLHKDKGQSFEEYLKFLLSFPLLNEKKHSSTFFYLIVGYYKQQLISSVFLYIPNKRFPQEMRFSFISNVIVLPDFKHKGIATKSITICESLSRKHYCSGILLATSNKTLKETFYSQLNFCMYKSDDWLLKKDLIVKNTAVKQCKEIFNVTPFDLATIQSLCAFPHYKIIDNIIEFVDCCEIEEDFISLAMKYPKQFLYVEIAATSYDPTIAWIIFDNEQCRQIIAKEKTIVEINDLLLKIQGFSI